MNQNGYTKIELVCLILFLGVISFFAINRMSYAFDDKTKVAYENELKLIKTCALKYGESKKDEVKNSVTGLKVSVNDLITFGCLKDVDKNGNYIDPRDNSKYLNNLELNLEYNPKTENIEVEVLK